MHVSFFRQGKRKRGIMAGEGGGKREKGLVVHKYDKKKVREGLTAKRNFWEMVFVCEVRMAKKISVVDKLLW